MEEKMKKLNPTAARLGIAMRHARRACWLPHDEVAILLRITPNALAEYERGTTEIPSDILERVFIMAYKMMHVRTLDNVYRRQRHMFIKHAKEGMET